MINFEDTIMELKNKSFFRKTMVKLVGLYGYSPCKVIKLYIFPFISAEIVECDERNYDSIIIEYGIIHSYKKVMLFYKNGLKFKELYYKDCSLHRLDGPAEVIIFEDEIIDGTYYIKGIEYNEELKYLVKADSYSEKQRNFWKNVKI